MHFDGASCRNGGAGIMLTSPKGDKLRYTVQLCFAMDKISNNIAEFEGLLVGLWPTLWGKTARPTAPLSPLRA